MNDVPKIQCTDPTERDHSIQFEGTDVRITLQLIGTTSYFDSVRPTMQEITEAMEEDSILEMNLEEDEWDPHDPAYSRQESLMLDFEGKIVEQRIRDRELLGDVAPDDDIFDTSAVQHRTHHGSHGSKVIDAMTPEGLSDLLQASSDLCESHLRAGITVGEVRMMDRNGDDLFFKVSSVSATKPSGVTPEELSKVFRIDINRARRTIDSTTQRI